MAFKNKLKCNQFNRFSAHDSHVFTAVDCGAYPSLPNGQPTPPNATTYNNTVSYQCNTGYKFNNNDTYAQIVCQNNSTWTNILSTCEGWCT